MACKNCKKNATKLTNHIMGKKTPINNGQEKDIEWLESEEGKKLSGLVKATSVENIILVVFAWTPLLIGYVTIIKFLYFFLTS
tara:strand:- start:198 stop:446 length:249 start_codon:yes stop_codon:yes gene_type:complete